MVSRTGFNPIPRTQLRRKCLMYWASPRSWVSWVQQLAARIHPLIAPTSFSSLQEFQSGLSLYHTPYHDPCL